MAEVMFVAGTGMKAYGQYQQGKERKRSAYAQADQLQRNAGIRRASSQREAADEREAAQLVESQALAAAAASGAGVTNPNMVRILGDLEAEGEIRAMRRMWAGHSEARGMEMEAENLRRGGKAAGRAGKLAAASTIFQGYSVWDQYYG